MRSPRNIVHAVCGWLPYGGFNANFTSARIFSFLLSSGVIVFLGFFLALAATFFADVGSALALVDRRAVEDLLSGLPSFPFLVLGLDVIAVLAFPLGLDLVTFFVLTFGMMAPPAAASSPSSVFSPVA